MKLTRIPHLDGDPAVAQTIRQMSRLIALGKKDPAIHELAAKILTTARVPAYDFLGEARAIFDWMNGRLRVPGYLNPRFTRDIDGHETLHAASDIVRLGIGDCDDFTVLTLSLLLSAGGQGHIVTVATDYSDGEFSHVYPEAEVNGRSIALDAARRNAAFGKSPERYTRKRLWSLESSEYVDMAGIRTSIGPREGPVGAWRANVYPPFRVGPSTGSYLSRAPIAPRAQQFRRPPQGYGNYGVPAARRALVGFTRGDMRRVLGQDDSGFDWSSITPIITAGTTGAANIIAAERASPYNLFPTTSTSAVRPATTPLVSPSLVPSLTSAFSTISPTTLLIGGALLAIAIAKR